MAANASGLADIDSKTEVRFRGLVDFEFDHARSVQCSEVSCGLFFLLKALEAFGEVGEWEGGKRDRASLCH